MEFFNFFRQKKQASASVARDRLTVAIGIQRASDGRNAAAPTYLQAMQNELLAVVRKYVQVPDSAVQIAVQKDGDLEVLEMNIQLGEAAKG